MGDDSKPPLRRPWHLWVVGLVGLAWNGVGATDFAMTQTRNDSWMGQLEPGQVQALYDLPAWLVPFWAIAVWGGVVGAVLILMGRAVAAPVLLASLTAMIITAGHDFASGQGLYSSGGTAPAFVLLIFGVALGLWGYARSLRGRGVLS